MARCFGLTAEEQLAGGCHVHAEVDSGEEGWGMFDRARVRRPVILAFSVQDLRNKVRLARRDLVQQPGAGAEPSVAAIATHTRLTEDEVRDGLQALDGFSALSLDAGRLSSGDDGFSLADALGAPDGSYDVITDREAAKAGLEHLPERERTILYLRFFEDMTQGRIAEHFGISQMHVSRLIQTSCRRVREEATRDVARRPGRGHPGSLKQSTTGPAHRRAENLVGFQRRTIGPRVLRDRDPALSASAGEPQAAASRPSGPPQTGDGNTHGCRQRPAWIDGMTSGLLSGGVVQAVRHDVLVQGRPHQRRGHCRVRRRVIGDTDQL